MPNVVAMRDRLEFSKTKDKSDSGIKVQGSR